MQLARQCQKIEQALKEANCSKLVQDWITEQTAKRTNNGYSNGKQTIVNPPVTSAALPANPSLTTSRKSQISQLWAQLVALSSVRSTTTTTSSATPWLTTEEKDQLIKFGRCFNCKEEGHTLRNCTRPNKPYLSVSAALQEVELVENSASELEKA